MVTYISNLYLESINNDRIEQYRPFPLMIKKGRVKVVHTFFRHRRERYAAQIVQPLWEGRIEKGRDF